MARVPKHIKRVTRPVDITYGSIETVIETLTKAAEGLNDAMLDVEVVTRYHDDYSIVCTVSGWVPMTRAEIAEKREETKNREAQQIADLEAQHARITEQLAARRKAAKRPV